jgi:chromosome segregation ATPase
MDADALNDALRPLEEIDAVLEMVEKEASVQIEKAHRRTKQVESELREQRDRTAQAEARALESEQKAQQRHSALNAEARRLREESTQKDASLEKQKELLANYVRDSRSRCSTLEQRYASLGDRFESLSKLYTTIVERNGGAENEHSHDSPVDLKLAGSSREDAGVPVNQKRLEELEAHVAENNNETEALARENAALEATVADLKAQLANAKNKLQVRQKRRTELEAHVAENSDETEALARENTALEATIADLRAQLASAQTQSASSEAAFGALQTKVAQLEAHVAENNYETEALARENTALEATIADLRARLANSQTQSASSEAAFSAERTNSQQLEQELHILKSEPDREAELSAALHEAQRQAQCLRDVLIAVAPKSKVQDAKMKEAVRKAEQAERELRHQTAVSTRLMRNGLSPETALAVEELNAMRGNMQPSTQEVDSASSDVGDARGFYMLVMRVFRHPVRASSARGRPGDEAGGAHRRFVSLDDTGTHVRYSQVEGAPPLRTLALAGVPRF